MVIKSEKESKKKFEMQNKCIVRSGKRRGLQTRSLGPMRPYDWLPVPRHQYPAYLADLAKLKKLRAEGKPMEPNMFCTGRKKALTVKEMHEKQAADRAKYKEMKDKQAAALPNSKEAKDKQAAAPLPNSKEAKEAKDRQVAGAAFANSIKRWKKMSFPPKKKQQKCV